MNILVANDDGIRAIGIQKLVRALSQKANIFVCAPEGQRSASGHGITVSQPITVEEMKVECAEIAFGISGTPADCIKLGMQLMKDRGVSIDMVYSGINLGGNLGTDTLYSGTVSAAVEGNLCGVPAVAVSVNDHMAQHFGFACELALEALENAKWISPDTVLNINTPNLPKEQIKGVKLTSLGRREYKNEFRNPETGDDGRALYSYGGEPVHYDGLPDTIDVVAMQNGYATVTPLHRDLTDYRMLNEMKKWRTNK